MPCYHLGLPPPYGARPQGVLPYACAFTGAPVADYLSPARLPGHVPPAFPYPFAAPGALWTGPTDVLSCSQPFMSLFAEYTAFYRPRQQEIFRIRTAEADVPIRGRPLREGTAADASCTGSGPVSRIVPACTGWRGIGCFWRSPPPSCFRPAAPGLPPK